MTALIGQCLTFPGGRGLQRYVGHRGWNRSSANAALRVVPVYAALMALLFVLLSVKVIRVRRSQRIPLGVGGNAELERHVRVQANFAEYAPFALLLLAMADIRGAPAALLHLLCLGLPVGRASHAWGVSQAIEDYRFRGAGMGRTLTVIIGAAILLMLG